MYYSDILIMSFETFSSRCWKSTSGWCTRKDSNFKYCKICTKAKISKGMSKESHCQNFQNSTLILGLAWDSYILFPGCVSTRTYSVVLF